MLKTGGVTALLLVVLVGCATSVERNRVTLSDLDPQLGERYESEDRINALHPANPGTDGTILWTDFCHTKECDDTEMKYTQLFREVGITVATVEQLDYVVRQMRAQVVTAMEVEPILELGWHQLPTLGKRIELQRMKLASLDPDGEFDTPSARTSAWDAIATAAEQLERAEKKLAGLDEAVATAYREIEPAFACEEPPEGFVLPPTAEIEEALKVASVRLREQPEYAKEEITEQEALVFVLRRGLEALSEERRLQVENHPGPAALESVEPEGALPHEAVATWVNGRGESLLACLPSSEQGPLPVDVRARYSADGVVRYVEIASMSLGAEVMECFSAALRGSAVKGLAADLPSEGEMRLQIVLRRPPSSTGTAVP